MLLLLLLRTTTAITTTTATTTATATAIWHYYLIRGLDGDDNIDQANLRVLRVSSRRLVTIYLHGVSRYETHFVASRCQTFTCMLRVGNPDSCVLRHPSRRVEISFASSGNHLLACYLEC